MKTHTRLLALILAKTALCSTALAQAPVTGHAPATPVTLAQAVEAAWQRAAAAREADALRHRALAEQSAAKRLWATAPMLELNYRTDRWQQNTGQRETGIGVAVPVWMPDQRTAHVNAADQALVQAQANERAAKLRLASEVREAAATLTALQAETALAMEETATLRSLADDVERRVRAGELARTDAMAVQAEALAASTQAAESQLRTSVAQQRWQLLTGLNVAPALEFSTTATPPQDNPSAIHPELELAQQNTALARSKIALLRATRREAPQVSVGVQQDTPGRGLSNTNSVVIGLSVPLGTTPDNPPQEAGALGELEVALVQEQRLRERIAADTAAAQTALQAATTQLSTEKTRTALLNERAQLIGKAFRAGETSLSELLRARLAAASANSALTRQHTALALAQARLQHSFGLLP
jgi:outer membrane protein, heavy metal efflux system